MRKRLAGLLHGDHDGLLPGSGSDPEEVVRYRPGEDDVRRIDWNVTARSAEPHVWRTRAEHELETWVLVDETASMDFGTVEVEKGELAAWVTGARRAAQRRSGQPARRGPSRSRRGHLVGPHSRRGALRSAPCRPAVRRRRRGRDRDPFGLAEAISLLGAAHRRPGMPGGRVGLRRA